MKIAFEVSPDELQKLTTLDLNGIIDSLKYIVFLLRGESCGG